MGLSDTPGIGPIFSAVSKFFGGDYVSTGEKTERSFLVDTVYPVPSRGAVAYHGYEPKVAVLNAQRHEWLTGDDLDREGGPAVTETNLKTGVVTKEEYWRNGRLDRRDGGPALVERDPATGQVTVEGWYQDDQQHRDNGPSLVGYGHGKGDRDPVTDAPLHQYWTIHGKGIDPPDVMPQQTPFSPAQTPLAPAAADRTDSVRAATRPRSPAP